MMHPQPGMSTANVARCAPIPVIFSAVFGFPGLFMMIMGFIFGSMYVQVTYDNSGVMYVQWLSQSASLYVHVTHSGLQKSGGSLLLIAD